MSKPKDELLQWIATQETQTFLEKSEVEKTRSKYALRQANQKLKVLSEQLAIAETRNEFLEGLRNVKSKPLNPIKPVKGKKREATIVALASDWHMEEVVEPSKVNNFNAYDPKLATKRANRYFEEIAKKLSEERGHYSNLNLVLWLGGDLISGYIHPELIEVDAMSPAEAIIFVQDTIVQGINFLRENCDVGRIVVPCSFGNHGRTTEKRRISTSKENSFEWIMYQQIARIMGKTNVEVIVSEGDHLYLPVYDEVIRFTHGENIPMGRGFGWLAQNAMACHLEWNRIHKATITCAGHFHQMVNYYNPLFGSVFINGSLIGYNSFALSIKATPEPPRQSGFIIEKDFGVTQTFCIPVE